MRVVLWPQAALRDQPQGPTCGLEDHPGTTADSAVLDGITRHLTGKLYADKGYFGRELFNKRWQHGLHLITGIRRNMRNYLMPLADNLMLRKRFVIDTVLDTLKFEMGLEHSRYRSVINAMVRALSCHVAYAFRPGKPSISHAGHQIKTYPLFALSNDGRHRLFHLLLWQMFHHADRRDATLRHASRGSLHSSQSPLKSHPGKTDWGSRKRWGNHKPHRRKAPRRRDKPRCRIALYFPWLPCIGRSRFHLAVAFHRQPRERACSRPSRVPQAHRSLYVPLHAAGKSDHPVETRPGSCRCQATPSSMDQRGLSHSRSASVRSQLARIYGRKTRPAFLCNCYSRLTFGLVRPYQGYWLNM